LKFLLLWRRKFLITYEYLTCRYHLWFISISTSSLCSLPCLQRSYADIKRITNHFTEKLGEEAYGTVFKGKLSNEIHVAVKMILNTSKENGKEFINEVGTMRRIHHVNIVSLVGLCADGF